MYLYKIFTVLSKFCTSGNYLLNPTYLPTYLTTHLSTTTQTDTHTHSYKQTTNKQTNKIRHMQAYTYAYTQTSAGCIIDMIRKFFHTILVYKIDHNILFCAVEDTRDAVCRAVDFMENQAIREVLKTDHSNAMVFYALSLACVRCSVCTCRSDILTALHNNLSTSLYDSIYSAIICTNNCIKSLASAFSRYTLSTSTKSNRDCILYAMCICCKKGNRQSSAGSQVVELGKECYRATDNIPCIHITYGLLKELTTVSVLGYVSWIEVSRRLRSFG